MKFESSRRLLLPACLVAFFVLGGMAQQAAAQHDEECLTLQCRTDLAAARAATSKYHDFQEAVDDQFAAVFPCLALPEGPAMGFHYVNEERASDGELDPASPELLIYLPNGSGEMKLVAVEYLLPGSPNDTPPVLFGQEMHYTPVVSSWTLHAWIWRDNPDGMFADFNPRLRCPA